MESALTFLYIGNQNPGERFIQYFLFYIETEKIQNRKWEGSLGECDEIAQNEHLRRIRKKDEVLEFYEDQLKTDQPAPSIP